VHLLHTEALSGSKDHTSDCRLPKFFLSLHFDIGNPRLDIDSLQSKRTSGKSAIGTGRYPLMDILVSVSVSVIYSCRQYILSKIAIVE
jgi:hypothetical protein